MKRKIKYIGEAVAVALLAAGAPVVIPMISSSGIVQAADLEDKTGELDLTSDTSNVTVDTGASLTDSMLQTGNSSLSIVTDSVTNLGTPIYGQSLYTTKAAAMSAAGNDNFDPTAINLGDAQSQVSNGKITVSGPYYQTISYKLSSDPAANSILNGGYNTYVDGKQGTNGTDFVLNKTAGTITIVRQFNVKGGISTNIENIKTVDINSSTDIDTTGYALFDGSKVIPTSLVNSDDYYIDFSLRTPATSDEIANGKFLKAGKYYHKISFILPSGDASSYDLPTGLTAQGNTITAIQEIDVNGTVNQGIQEPNVNVGESVSSNKDIDGNTLTNSKGSLVDTTKGDYNGVSFGSSYYKEGTSNSDILNNSVTADTDVVDSSGDFAKTGTYLRTITFNLIGNSVDTETFGTKEGSDYKLDTQNNTVTYVQKVHIGPEPKFAVPEVTSALLVDQSVLTQADAAEKIPVQVVVGAEDTTIGNSVAKITAQDTVTINKDVSTDWTYGNFYSTSEAALTGDSNYEVLQGQTEFKTGGTYYRTITFNLKDADKYNIYYIDGYDDQDEPILTPYIKDKDYKIGKDNDSVIFAKEYDVYTTKVSIPDISVSVKKGYRVGDIKLPGFTYVSPDSTNVILTGIYSKDGEEHTRTWYSYTTGDVYYDDIKDALTRTDAMDTAKLFGDEKTDEKTDDKTFQTIGTYYRVITFDLSKGLKDRWELVDSKGKQDGMVTQDKNTYTTYHVVQPITVTSENEVKPTIASPTPNIGDSVADEQNAEANDVTSKYGTGKSIVDPSGKIEFGTEYYPTTTRVKDILNDTATGAVDGVVADDGTYALAGTYYRTITIPINDDSTYEYDPTSSKPSDDKKILTYVQTVTIPKKATGATGEIVTDVSVKVKDNKDLSSIENYTLADGNKSLIDTTNDKSGVSFGDDYYTDVTATTKVDPSIAYKYTITEPGKYFRKVIFDVSDETLANYDFDGISGKVEGNTVTFMQEVDVTAASSNSGSGSSGSNSSNTNSGGSSSSNTNSGDDNSSNDNNDEWTYYQNPGVVRTINGQDYYSLNNQANGTISNRALAKKSSWITDQYRTNRAGVKEYRVATGEWIDARDVTFIKDIKNVVNVDETSSYYSLYNIDGEVNSSRALEKNTSWQTDKKAIDPEGNVYYRVATNEWVKQIKGVYLDTYARY